MEEGVRLGDNSVCAKRVRVGLERDLLSDRSVAKKGVKSSDSLAKAGKAKIFESKKEKRRPRLILSDSEPDDDLTSHQKPDFETSRNENGSVDKIPTQTEIRHREGAESERKAFMIATSKRSEDAEVDRKEAKMEPFRIRREADNDRKRIKVDQFRHGDRAEIVRKEIKVNPSKRKGEADFERNEIKSDHFKCREETGIDRKRIKVVPLKCRDEAEIDRKKIRLDPSKHMEEVIIDRREFRVDPFKRRDESEAKAIDFPGGKLVTYARQRDGRKGSSGNNFAEMRPQPILGRKNSTVVERPRETDHLSAREFRMQKNKNSHLGGITKEKPRMPHDLGSIRLQGKGGVLRLMSNRKRSTFSLPEISPTRRDIEEWAKNARSEVDLPRQKKISHQSTGFNLENSGSSSIPSKKIHRGKPSFVPSDRVHKQEAKGSNIPIRVAPKCMDEEITDGETNSTPQSSSVHAAVVPLSGKKKETKEAEVRRRRQERCLLRQRLKNMLLSAGWIIDLRPRKGRNYQDSVYISPTKVAYWSIVNAYNAFRRESACKEPGQLGLVKPDVKYLSGELVETSHIPLEDLSILTRKTKAKIAKESGKGKDEKMAKKKKKKKKKKHADGACSSMVRDENQRKNLKGATKQHFLKKNHVKESMYTCTNRVKFSSGIARKNMALKGRIKENGITGLNSKGLSQNLYNSNSNLKKPSYLSDPVDYCNVESSLRRLSGEPANSAGPSCKGMPGSKTPKPVRTLKPSLTSNAYPSQGRKNKKRRECALMVRSSSKGDTNFDDHFIPYSGKRNVLSWLIDSGVVPENGRVHYMNKKRTRVMMDGWITRDGIHCGCCSKILTVSKFEIHAGSKLRQPFQNILLETGISLMQCQLEAWNAQDESERCGFHVIDLDGSDQNDDTCGICGDGGDLICCDGCPSTFHLCCLDLQTLPPGDWHCPYCSCKFCGLVSARGQGEDGTVYPVFSCVQCEEKYHCECTLEKNAMAASSAGPRSTFCGKDCQKLFKRLQDLLGVKNDLEEGFSWTLIQRFDGDSATLSRRGLAQRAECNSRIAVALTVMDECFMPIIDQRSRINMIHNVLYNCGSNFNRLNYSGFYTVILERGDEVISAASIRIHGTRLAEMPLIGTRHIYRRQGMCRRLLNAIESVLRSLKVEKLIIPAISELMQTWTTVFGFKLLEESHKQEMKSLNMMVFPGTDMLQKSLFNHGFTKGRYAQAGADVANGLKCSQLNNCGEHIVHDNGLEALPSIAFEDSDAMCTGVVNESDCGQNNTSDVANKSFGASLMEPNLYDSSKDTLQGAAAPTNLLSLGEGSVHHTSDVSSTTFAPTNLLSLGEGSVHHTSDVSSTTVEAAFNRKVQYSAENTMLYTSKSIHESLDVANKAFEVLPLEHNLHTSSEGAASDTCQIKLETATEPNLPAFGENSVHCTEIRAESLEVASGHHFDSSVDDTTHHTSERINEFHEAAPDGACLLVSDKDITCDASEIAGLKQTAYAGSNYSSGKCIVDGIGLDALPIVPYEDSDSNDTDMVSDFKCFGQDNIESTRTSLVAYLAEPNLPLSGEVTEHDAHGFKVETVAVGSNLPGLVESAGGHSLKVSTSSPAAGSNSDIQCSGKNTVPYTSTFQEGANKDAVASVFEPDLNASSNVAVHDACEITVVAVSVEPNPSNFGTSCIHDTSKASTRSPGAASKSNLHSSGEVTVHRSSESVCECTEASSGAGLLLASNEGNSLDISEVVESKDVNSGLNYVCGENMVVGCDLESLPSIPFEGSDVTCLRL